MNERKPYGPVKQGNPRSSAGRDPGQVRGKADPYEHKKQGNPSSASGQDVERQVPRGYVKSQSAGVTTRKNKGPHKVSP